MTAAAGFAAAGRLALHVLRIGGQPRAVVWLAVGH